MLYFYMCGTCSCISPVNFSGCGTCSSIYLYFFTCGIHSGILRDVFECVERALVYCVICFGMCNALWYCVLSFSECGTRSSILCCTYLRLKCDLLFSYIFFLLFLNFVLYYTNLDFLWFFPFRLFETIFDIDVLLLCNFVLYFSLYGTHSGLV